MRSPARLRIAASLLVVVAAAACSDSTGPGQQTAAQVAAHFDSIAIRANAQSDTNSAYGVRSFLTTLIELPAALGAVPSTVSVTTASGVEQWKAYELLEVMSPGSSNTDSSFILLAFRDADAHTAIAVFFDSTGTAQDGGIITGDTISVNPSQGAGTTSLTSTSTTCATPSGSLHNPQLGTLAISQCNLAKFRTSLALTSPTTPGMDAALTTVTFTNATVNGVRAVDQASGATIRRVKAMLRSASNKTSH
jgi:hypothetical protein